MEPPTGKIQCIFLLGGSADKNGLRIGDYIVKAGDKTPPFLQKSERKPGDKVQML